METSNNPRPAQYFNENQIRRVRIILQHFEEDLRLALHWLDRNPDEGYLYRRKLVLSEDLREKARQSILQGLEEVRRLAETLDFEPESENAARIILGHLSIDWENLSGLHARDLKGFGAVHPNLPHILDEPAERLSQIAMELTHLFIRGPIEINDPDSSPGQETR
ncbi:MAG: hypothetical protein M1281_12215 [Chloroflexi bacterium]|nr:hypothetical protein [Chloroflexota bacterium]